MYIAEMALDPIRFNQQAAVAVIGYFDGEASYRTDGDVFLLDSQTGSRISSRGGNEWEASSLCTVTVGGEVLLAGARKEGMIQLWEPRSGEQVRTLNGGQKPVSSLCHIDTGHSSLLAGAGPDGEIRLWDPLTGKHIRTIQSNDYWPDNLCAIGSGPGAVLASSSDRKIHLWNPADGSYIRTLEGCPGSIYALCVADSSGSPLLATGEGAIDKVLLNRGEVDEDAVNHAVRLWNPVSGEQVGALEEHSDDVNAVCSFSIRDRSLLASAGRDGVVRIWDIASRASIVAIPVYYSVTCMIWAEGSLFIGLESGVLAIRLEDGVLTSQATRS